MKEYANRHYDESVLNVLEGLRRDAIYSCSDPRLHIKEREQVNKQLSVTSRTSRTYKRLSMTILVIMEAFLTM